MQAAADLKSRQNFQDKNSGRIRVNIASHAALEVTLFFSELGIFFFVDILNQYMKLW